MEEIVISLDLISPLSSVERNDNTTVLLSHRQWKIVSPAQCRTLIEMAFGAIGVPLLSSPWASQL